MIKLILFHSMHPLVNPRRQKLFAAENFINGEVVGKAYNLFTHAKFYEFHFKQSVLETDYSFSLITGGNAFSIDSSTGIISISDITQFTATTIITVRCTFKGTYHEDQEITIERIPIANAVYIDYTFIGTSTGSRTQPYIRARNYPSGNRYGKTFFYKSGVDVFDEYLTIINADTDPWTNFARWGTGTRPRINLSQNAESNRFMNFGSSSVSTDNGYNIRVCEIDFYHDCSTNIYPFRLRGQSGAIEIYNCKFEGTTQRQGFIWGAGDSTNVTDPLPKHRIFSNLEFSDFREQIVDGSPDGCRCVKFERGGNIAENLKAVSTFTGLNSATVSAVDQPYTDIRWLYSDTSTSNNNRGPNIRTSFQTYENCYIVGPNEPIAIANNNQTGFQVDYPVDGTSCFKNCIVENAASSGISFFNEENLIEDAPATAVKLEGIITINCQNGITFGNGVRNVEVISCAFIRSINNGIRQTGGTGNKLTNCLSLFSGVYDVNVSGSLELRNSIFQTETGATTKTTCSDNILEFIDSDLDDFNLIEGASLIGAGTFFQQNKDLIGYNYSNPPSIGVFEFIPPPLPNPVIRYLKFTVTPI